MPFVTLLLPFHHSVAYLLLPALTGLCRPPSWHCISSRCNYALQHIYNRFYQCRNHCDGRSSVYNWALSWFSPTYKRKKNFLCNFINVYKLFGFVLEMSILVGLILDSDSFDMDFEAEMSFLPKIPSTNDYMRLVAWMHFIFNRS